MPVRVPVDDGLVEEALLLQEGEQHPFHILKRHALILHFLGDDVESKQPVLT